VRVRVIAADPLVRTGLGSLLAGQAGLEVEPDAELPSAAEVVVVDLAGAGDGAWSELASATRPVLALVSSPEQAREAVAAGARGVVLRDSAGEPIGAALRALAEGLTVLDPRLAEAVLRPPAPPARELVEPLTPREREVLALLVQGFTNRAIGERLGISEHTAKFHVNAILGKLGVESRTEAVAQAARLGLVVL
jgi:DNA-binding NarL/FixJ family response regulator